MIFVTKSHSTTVLLDLFLVDSTKKKFMFMRLGVQSMY